MVTRASRSEHLQVIFFRWYVQAEDTIIRDHERPLAGPGCVLTLRVAAPKAFWSITSRGRGPSTDADIQKDVLSPIFVAA